MKISRIFFPFSPLFRIISFGSFIPFYVSYFCISFFVYIILSILFFIFLQLDKFVECQTVAVRFRVRVRVRAFL